MLWELIKQSTDVKGFDGKQILSTNSLKKCMEISLEDLYLDIGALRVKEVLLHLPW